MILLAILLPLLLSLAIFKLAKIKENSGFYMTSAICLISLVLLVFSKGSRLQLPYFFGFHISFSLDHIRWIYSLVTGFMWFLSSLFSKEYLNHGKDKARYMLFSLITFSGCLGVFMADDFITLFVFFEIMSLASYPFVAHENTQKAKRAAQSYLAIAVFGGMSVLTGLFMLYPITQSFDFSDILAATQSLENNSVLYIPSLLMLLGFGAKAGMFPLHVWLPKAHPVAPAPLSALLSGVLTKTGIFGVIYLSSRVLLHDETFANIILALALITMFSGAFFALLSIDLKQTLAYSSMSQMGFVLFGIATNMLLKEHGSISALGTTVHMLNHSLVKLALFLSAGAVYLSTHSLNLNDIKGTGRKSLLLKIVFIAGAATLSGIPLFSGYLSKTLLHEGMVEYIQHVQHLGQSSGFYSISEIVFIVTGGLTFAYMLKLYTAIFVKKGEKELKKLSSPSAFALILPSIGLIALAVYNVSLPYINKGLDFFGAHPMEHMVEFFNFTNLKGGAMSLLIGAFIYVFVVEKLIYKDGIYRDLRPKWLDIEDYVYRPFIKRVLIAFPVLLCKILANLPNIVFYLFKSLTLYIVKALSSAPDFVFSRLARKDVVKGVTKAFAMSVDGFFAFIGRTVFSAPKERKPVPIGNIITYNIGKAADKLAMLKAKIKNRPSPIENRNVIFFARLWVEVSENLRRLLHGLSFSLFMFALGLLVIMLYMFLR